MKPLLALATAALTGCASMFAMEGDPGGGSIIDRSRGVMEYQLQQMCRPGTIRYGNVSAIAGRVLIRVECLEKKSGAVADMLYELSHEFPGARPVHTIFR